MGFAEASHASVKTAKEDAKESAKFKEKELELKEEVAELGVLKLVFSGNDEDSVRYREV